MPIVLRKSPDPKYNAAASKTPIPTAKTNAVETDGSSFFTSVSSRGIPWLLSL